MAFSGYLRRKNYRVGIEEVTSALRAVQLINIGDYPAFIRVLQISFARSKEQWQDLSKNYLAFKKEYEKSLDAKLLEKEDEERSAKERETPPINYQIDDIKKWLYNIKEVETVDAPFYSPFSSTDEKAFHEFDDDVLLQLDYWIKQMLLRLAFDRRRRKTRNTYQGDIDLKALLRNRFIHGDELVKLYYRYPKKEKTKIVFLCDVSKSMDMYSRFLTSLSKQLPKVFSHCGCYFFNTDLYELKSSTDFDKIKGLWVGGTRIGWCFNQWLEQAPPWVDKKTKILVYSDGWDTGDLDLLEESMFLMKKMVGKIIWLNPTITRESDIEISGMKVAQKYIDVLAPVYNLQTLKEFVREL